jgi:hypothetical protein
MALMNMYRTFPFRGETGAPAPAHHVFLIAIQDPPAPILHRGDVLHRMQAILAGPAELPPLLRRDSAIGPLPALPSPHQLLRNVVAAASLLPREVTGEILRDAQGRLYERNGDHVRPMTRLFTGGQGEVIDLAPVADANAENDKQDSGPEPTQGELDEKPRATGSRRERRLRDLARRLLPQPGLWRLVRYADFIDEITPQLAHARRLQPGHQLACYLQLHEVVTETPLLTLEAAAARELGAAGKLLPLSYDLCRRFAISLPRPAFALASARQACSPGIVPAGARFLTLRVALDPTAEISAPVSGSPPPGDSPTAPSAMTAAPDNRAAQDNRAPAASSKTTVPAEFIKPWEQRLSREEAMYDMTIAASRGATRRLIDRLLHRPSRRLLRKWHALLRDKSPDQQLWGVKPPRGSLCDNRVRRWAEQTLQLGGYDVGRMLVEWELHWRRQGL